MHADPTAQPPVPVTYRARGRHRREVLEPRRARRSAGLTTRVGGVVTLASLALIGTAVAASLAAPAPAAERPTVTVTYGMDR